MSAVLDARDLSFTYGRRTVLRGVSLVVAPGDDVGVIGPNGSGKTTLLRLLGGATRPHSGEVVLGGRPLRSLRPREIARRIAVVPQDPRMDFPFTALEVVLMGRAPRLGAVGLAGRRDLEVARAALDRLEVLRVAERSIDHLSGGERQRVFLARALAQEPEVLLLDEPTVHLDLRHQIGILEAVRSLRSERGLAVVTVLHDLNLAARYCDRLLLLAEGGVAVAGAPDEVLTAASLSAVFGTPVTVERHAGWDQPLVLPAPHARTRSYD